MKTEEKKKTEETKKGKNKDSELTDTLVRGMVEGVGESMLANAFIPGAGLAVSSLNQANGMKKVAKSMGTGVVKKEIDKLDGDPQERNPAEELSSDIAMEVLGRIGGQPR